MLFNWIYLSSSFFSLTSMRHMPHLGNSCVAWQGKAWLPARLTQPKRPLATCPPTSFGAAPAQHLFHLNNQMSFRFQITAAICLTRPGVSLASSAWPTWVTLFPPLPPLTPLPIVPLAQHLRTYTRILAGPPQVPLRGTSVCDKGWGRQGEREAGGVDDRAYRVVRAQCCKRALIILDALLLTPQQLTLECSSHLSVLEDVNVLRTMGGYKIAAQDSAAKILSMVSTFGIIHDELPLCIFNYFTALPWQTTNYLKHFIKHKKFAIEIVECAQEILEKKDRQET